jgi:hypothetical protein
VHDIIDVLNFQTVVGKPYIFIGEKVQESTKYTTRKITLQYCNVGILTLRSNFLLCLPALIQSLY